MQTIVIAFNYVDYQDKKKFERQKVAIEVLSQTPSWVFPIALNYTYDPKIQLKNIDTFNVLKRNSKDIIGNTRSLPYIKEILDFAAKIDCDKIGYINSDILVSESVLNALQSNLDAYIFSRYEIAEIDSKSFKNGKTKMIYGGDTHVGADGFFFNREWWINNRDIFPYGLLVGETEWDTVYRKAIQYSDANFIEKRCLYHVYHDAKWDLKSPGAKNNIEIWEKFKEIYELSN